MSDEQEQDTPVWHAIVGEGWRPVQFGEQTRQGDEVLAAGGWQPCREYGLSYTTEGAPRRRRESSYEILVIKDGADYCRMRAVKPGECIKLNECGELIPVDKPPAESAE